MKILAQQHWSDITLQQQGNVNVMTVIQVAFSSKVDYIAQ